MFGTDPEQTEEEESRGQPANQSSSKNGH